MMVDIDELGDRVEALGRQLLELQLRLQKLEARYSDVRRLGARRAAADDDSGSSRSPSPASPGALEPGSIALFGRALVVLGGAYLFRAVSERGLVPPLAGAVAALLYAALWIVVSDRSAAKGRRRAALFHGGTGVVIGVSLVWEATVRLSLVGVEVAGVALCGVFALAFGVGIRRDLRKLAWLSLMAHLVAAFAIMLGSREFLPMTWVLLVSALAVEGGVRERWPAMRWPAALGLDAAGALLITVTVSPQSAQGPSLSGLAVTAALLALPIVYLGSSGVRTLARARPVSVFDAVQAALALAVGLGGAVLVARSRNGSAIPFAVATLLTGVGLYAFGLPAVARRLARGTSFHVYGAFAGLLLLAGLALALPSRTPLALCCAVLALSLVAIGLHRDRLDLHFHGAAYGIAALFFAGLASAAFEGMFAAPESWVPVGPVDLAVLAACSGAALALMARPLDPAEWIARLPRAGLAAAAVMAGLGVSLRWLGAWSSSLDGEEVGPAALASIRSVLLALAAIGLAGVGRHRALAELRWLAYPVLAAGAAQLVFEAVRIAEPVVIFIALAAYGGALIATSRLLGSGRNGDLPSGSQGASIS